MRVDPNVSASSRIKSASFLEQQEMKLVNKYYLFLFLFAIAEVQLNNSLLCGEPAVVKRTRSLCVNDLAGMYWSFRQHPCKFLPSLQVTVSIKAWSSLYVHIARSGSVFNLSSLVKISYIWANLGGGAECTSVCTRSLSWSLPIHYTCSLPVRFLGPSLPSVDRLRRPAPFSSTQS